MRTDLVHASADLEQGAVEHVQAAVEHVQHEEGMSTSVKFAVVMVSSLLVLCLMATTTLAAVHYVQMRELRTTLGETSVSLQGGIGLVQDLSNAQSVRIEQLVNATMMLIKVLQGYSP